MARILVVGGGFAGVWSAASAAHLRQAGGNGPRELAITPIAPGDDFVVRPRLYEADAALAPDGHRVMQSCQHAIPLGKFAGHHAAAELLGYDPQPFAADPYLTCLDLGLAGALFTTGWERVVELTGPAAKALKRRITGELIYPPFDDGEELMRHANPVHPTAAADFLVR
jgi:NADH:ubiquinone reductase (H+-translocating)